MEGAGGSDATSLLNSPSRGRAVPTGPAPHVAVPHRDPCARERTPHALAPTHTLVQKPEWQQKSEAIMRNQVTTAKRTVMENEDWGNSLENSFTEKQDTKV